jgi:dipeptidase E
VKKLVLYSDQISPLSDKIDTELIALFNKSSPVVGFIPSKSDPQRKYYKERQAYYKRIGMDLRIYFELDNDFQPDMLNSLLSCDAIHLSGGNTDYFLHWLCKRAMLDILRQYVKRGGVLIGVSAGSIMMGPDISVGSLMHPESVNLNSDLSSLNLVNFTFVPHYGDKISSSIIPFLQQFSREHHIVVYVCRDSGGIIVTDDKIKLVGDVFKIDEG